MIYAVLNIPYNTTQWFWSRNEAIEKACELVSSGLKPDQVHVIMEVDFLYRLSKLDPARYMEITGKNAGIFND